MDATFRVTGKAPELWHAETGKTEPASYKIADGRTTVPLHLEPWGTVFVVFRKPTRRNVADVTAASRRRLATVDGPWKVSFQPDRGAPASITLDKLVFLERQRGCGREVLLRHGYLHQDDSGSGGVVQAKARSCGSIWAM